MSSVLASSVVDNGLDPLLGQIKDYEIIICCFSAKHAALRAMSKDWLARNHDNVSKCGDIVYQRTVVSLVFSMYKKTKCMNVHLYII
jgi:hypothetical protein